MKKCYLNYALAAFLITTLPACGLDDRGDHGQPAPAPVETQPNSPKPVASNPSSPEVKGPTFTMEWAMTEATNNVYTLTRSILMKEGYEPIFKLNGPLTLHEYHKDSVQITLSNLPVKLKAQTTRIKPILKVGIKENALDAPPAGMRITPDPISYQIGGNGLSNIQFTLSGINTLLPDSSDNEARMYVSVDFLGDSKADKFTVEFLLTTPPSKFAFVQKSLNEYERTLTLPEEIKYMESDSTKLSLIQVVEVTDLSDQPIAIELPTKVTGKLSQKRIWTDPQYGEFAKTVCYDMPKTVETNEVYSTDFILLPLSMDLTATWKELLKNESNDLQVTPGEKNLFGVFATPTKFYEKDFKSLLKNRSPKEFAKNNPVQTVTIDIACNFDCASFNLSDRFKNQCSNTPPSDGTNSRKSCETRVSNCLSCFKATGPFKSICGSCRTDELVYEPDIESYKGEYACLSGWKKTPTKSKQAKKGTELGPILLEITDSNVMSYFRYANLPKKDDPSSRTDYILLKSTVQDQ
ncbi:MAG: hypothetical protein HYX41_07110 [Bdellovibrio sp.]|nr:hypothetical protein [Bdellovibrio sp.]